MPGHTAGHAFGLFCEADFPLPGLVPAGTDAGAHVTLELLPIARVLAAFSGLPELVWETVFSCDRAVALQRGVAGDHLFSFGDDALFHVDTDATRVLWAPRVADDPACLRFLADTVLWTVAVLRRIPCVHGAVVAIDGQGVAISAESGGGKTTLALELQSRDGVRFVSDDVAAMTPALEVWPGPRLMNAPVAVPPHPGSRVLAQLEDELWLALDDGVTAPVSLHALILLDRSPGAQLRLEAIEPTLWELLPHTMYFGGSPASWALSFAAAADLAAGVPVMRLSAPPEATPAQLADAIMKELRP